MGYRLPPGFRNLDAHGLDCIIVAFLSLDLRGRESSSDQSIEQRKRTATRDHDGPAAAIRVFSQEYQGMVAVKRA
jgi:hypothetical protein